ncbi:Sec-independent protein translocase subunit TatA [Cellulomonas marina]|uniref:Sec-independent protein translocase protein TatA n=1 Tax=Cellulomonas marina TaxID=988821 RepID=A0A1I0WB10_9CELL|nr:Sec-independent protein translocase subunit TatA [Cellulomonas marina]GIG29080.1 hypothetical protein Cma02nite_16800 [Cellulomonas marina]SFA85400.1 sec-independent protein translocase protein TatA [Cellulomonas marina]
MRPTATHLIILLLVVVLLFGANRLPGLARSVGQSLKIFKSEVKDLRTDDEATPPAQHGATSTTAAPAPTAYTGPVNPGPTAGTSPVPPQGTTTAPAPGGHAPQA